MLFDRTWMGGSLLALVAQPLCFSTVVGAAQPGYYYSYNRVINNRTIVEGLTICVVVIVIFVALVVWLIRSNMETARETTVRRKALEAMKKRSPGRDSAPEQAIYRL